LPVSRRSASFRIDARPCWSIRRVDLNIDDLPNTIDIEELFYFKPDAGQLFLSPADETPTTFPATRSPMRSMSRLPSIASRRRRRWT
jgi:hypothetical protein